MEKLSTHFSIWEFERSQTAKRLGISNKMNETEILNAEGVAHNVLEPIRKHFGCSIYISSGFRGKALNKAINGSSTSQHCKGEAVDIDMDGYYGVTNAEIFRYVLNNIDFDQLIWEFGDDKNPDWVHISYSINKQKQRNEVLRAVRTKDGVQYHKYI